MKYKDYKLKSIWSFNQGINILYCCYYGNRSKDLIELINNIEIKFSLLVQNYNF